MEGLSSSPCQKEDLQELMEKAAVAGAKAGIDRYEAELKDRQKSTGIRGTITQSCFSEIIVCCRSMRKILFWSQSDGRICSGYSG